MADQPTSLRQAGSLNATVTVLRLLLTAAAVPVLLAHFGRDGYGTWAFVTAAAGTAGLVDLGTSTATSVFLSRAMSTRDVTAGRAAVANGCAIALSCAVISVSLVFVLAPSVAGLFRVPNSIGKPLVVECIRLSGALVFLKLLLGAPIGIEEGFLAFRQKSLLLATESILANGSLLLTATLTGSIRAVLLSQLAVTSFVLCLHIRLVSSLLRAHSMQPGILPSWEGSYSQLRMGAGSLLGSASIVAFSLGDRLIVGAALGPGVLAYYVAVISLCQQAQAVCVSFLQPIVARSARMAGDRFALAALAKEVFRVGATTTTLVMSGGVVGVALLGPYIPGVKEVPRLAFVVGLSAYGMLALSAGPYYLLIAERRTFVVSLSTAFATSATLAGLKFLISSDSDFAAIIGVNSLYGIFLTVLFVFLPTDHRISKNPLLVGYICQGVVFFISVNNLFGNLSFRVCVLLSLLNCLLWMKWAFHSGLVASLFPPMIGQAEDVP